MLAAIVVAIGFAAVLVVLAIAQLSLSGAGAALLFVGGALLLGAVARELIRGQRSAIISAALVGGLFTLLGFALLPDVGDTAFYAVPGLALALLVTVPPSSRAYLTADRRGWTGHTRQARN